MSAKVRSIQDAWTVVTHYQGKRTKKRVGTTKADRRKAQKIADEINKRLALTIAEAAAAVGVSERHLRTVLPEIPHLHLGARIVIPIDALRGWLRERAETEVQGAAHIADEILDFLNSD